VFCRHSEYSSSSQKTPSLPSARLPYKNTPGEEKRVWSVDLVSQRRTPVTDHTLFSEQRLATNHHSLYIEPNYELQYFIFWRG
jgi:hypothetical protein